MVRFLSFPLQSFAWVSVLEVVLDEVRQTLGRLDTLRIPIHPVGEFLRHGAHLALEVIAGTFFLAHTCPYVQFLTFGKFRDSVATAEGMPACELELLRIYTSEVIAYIIARMIVGNISIIDTSTYFAGYSQ